MCLTPSSSSAHCASCLSHVLALSTACCAAALFVVPDGAAWPTLGGVLALPVTIRGSLRAAHCCRRQSLTGSWGRYLTQLLGWLPGTYQATLLGGVAWHVVLRCCIDVADNAPFRGQQRRCLAGSWKLCRQHFLTLLTKDMATGVTEGAAVGRDLTALYLQGACLPVVVTLVNGLEEGDCQSRQSIAPLGGTSSSAGRA